MPGREEGRRNSEDEQEQGKNSQQLVLPASGGFNEGTPASSMELDLPHVRCAHGERGGAGKCRNSKGSKKISVQFPESTSDSRGCTPARLVNANVMRESSAKKRNSQGKDPRTFEEDTQGGDLTTPSNKQPGKGHENLQRTS